MSNQQRWVASSMARSVALATALGTAACTPERAPVSCQVKRNVPGTVFLDTPWPSDLLVDDDGHLDLRGFPNPYNSDTLREFLGIFSLAPGFAATSTLYFKVQGGVDGATLPQTQPDSLADDAAMFVVELASNRRLPFEWASYPEGTSFLPPGTVAVRLSQGVVPEGPYALVVTSQAHRLSDGMPLGPDADLKTLMTCGDLGPNLRHPVDCRPFQALRDTLKQQRFGLGDDDIALLQVVHPQDATVPLRAGYEAALRVQPVISAIRKRPGTTRTYDTFDGVMTIARYQAGTPPYPTYDGVSGGFVLGDDGLPVVQATEEVPFVLTVPKTGMPSGGYPVVINGHGTGGDLESGLGDVAGGEAHHIGLAGAAMFSISEPMHRTRAGYGEGQENTLTFNFFNPNAGRDNWLQSTLEKVQQVSAVPLIIIDKGVAGRPVDVRFDAGNVGFFGHSQGGLVGGMLLGIETRISGALLSGAGAGFSTSMVEKTDPPPAIADILRLVLSIPADEAIDLFHPVPSALQSFVDPADPVNYGRSWRHRPGHTPHLVVTSGLLDTFTPKRNHAGMAAAFGLPLADPVAEPLISNELLGIAGVGSHVEGNLRSDDGAPLTAAIVQFPDDGHFAIFQNPSAQRIFTAFFASLASGAPAIDSRAP